MSEESMQFREGTSDKFWKIKLEGNSFTVHFGRVGTAGQAQTKSFGSAAEAQKAYDKLVAEKLKKGYTRTGEAVGALPTPTVVAQKSSADSGKTAAASVSQAATAGEPSDSATEVMDGSDDAGTVKTVSAGVAVMERAEPAADAIRAEKSGSGQKPDSAERRLHLSAEDLNWAVWRPRARKERVDCKEKPFDAASIFEQLRAMPPLRNVWHGTWQERHANEDSMSRREAVFWLTLYLTWDSKLESENYYNPVTLGEDVRAVLVNQNAGVNDIDEELILAEFRREEETRTQYRSYLGHTLHWERLAPLMFRCLDPKQVIHLALSIKPDCAFPLMLAFRDRVLPYLSDSDLSELQDMCREKLNAEHALFSAPDSLNWSAFTVAAFLRMGDQMTRLLDLVPDTGGMLSLMKTSVFHPHLYFISQGSKDDVIGQTRRIGLPLRHREVWFSFDELWARAWVAATEYEGIQELGDLAATAHGKEEGESLFKCLTLVEAPETVPYVISLLTHQYVAPHARRWLQTHPNWSAALLYDAASARGDLAKAADEVLGSIRHRLDETLVDSKLVRDIRKRYESPDDSLDEMDEASTPDWLKAALAQVSASKGGLPPWLDLAVMPRLVVGKHKLNLAQMSAVTEGLKQSSFDKVHALVAAVRENVGRRNCDRFVWALFDSWLKHGAESKQKWAMQAVGLLGGDESAVRLVPLVRIWPGESQHQRAVFGLECLRCIGSDTALMQINGLAQKLQFKALKQKAAECMEQIAEQRGMSRAELEDRIVPDCGLDEKGRREFDYGPRQFQFALSADLKAMVREPDGKLKSDLPKPNSKDDPEKSKLALDDWKLLKQQIKDVAKVQGFRLEQAMITGRRWQTSDFETFLVRHPLMFNIIRMVVWGQYDADGVLKRSFRVTDDQSYADDDEREYRLDPTMQVGIVHPMQMAGDSRTRWGEVLTDYEIIQPFAQLERPVHSLEDNERDSTDIVRFAEFMVPAVSLVGTLEKQGWTRGSVEDGGVFHFHSKCFPGANAVAIVTYEGVPVGMMTEWEDQSIENCYFLRADKCAIKDVYSWEIGREMRLRLSDVDPIAVSEVLSDLILISSKAR